MRKLMDRLYWCAGAAGGGLIVLICLLISAQVILNGLVRAFPGVFPSTIPGYQDISGFMLAGSTFLSLAYTLRSGTHIRVNLITRQLSSSVQLLLEGLVLVTATALVGYATYYMAELVVQTRHFGDVSVGMVRIPIWIPQVFACSGLVLLTLSLLHTLLDLIIERRPVLVSGEEL